MARTGSETTPTPADHQQMDRSNDPEVTRAMNEAAPEAAMISRRQRLTGSATGIGSVGYDDSGAFDVGANAQVPGEPEPGAAAEPQRLVHPAPQQGMAEKAKAGQDADAPAPPDSPRSDAR